MPTIGRDIPKNFNLPRRINRLGEMAYNLCWTWSPEARRVFFQIDPPLWDRVRHNPVAFLQKLDRPKINAAIADRKYLKLYDEVMTEFDAYINKQDTFYAKNYPEYIDKQIAYFSFEFGLSESVPVYAGGLGVLAGDFLKEASDLGVPMIAIGFIYREGYFTQHITEDGWQETKNYYQNFDEMPITPVMDENGIPQKITFDLPERQVTARIWLVRVGRIPLYLLDTDVEENNPTDRKLNARLYSSDPETRITQEIILGIGGIRAIRSIGYDPKIYHMNEGHAAFLILERIREYVAKGKSFEEAEKYVRQTNIFTTHTPVPAGIDQFPVWLVERFFYNYWTQLGLDRDSFLAFARQTQDYGENFNMAILALKGSEYRNGVSELHGRVSRRMFHFLWSNVKEDDVPITHITNGVHTLSWLGRRMGWLYEKYLGKDWLYHVDEPDMWEKIMDVPNQELWDLRLYHKGKLLTFMTERIRQQWWKCEIHPVQVVAGGVLMDPKVLTIGFARRFSTYKRAYLLLRDYDRLLRIITDEDRPVQIIFSGKAHPADEPGKLLIQQVYRAVKDAKSGGRMVFLEDYDMNVARYLVQGVDVWMNTPRRPLEASGTSGMKAALNGALNFSVLDGWWHEAYNGYNGWAIGDGTEYSDTSDQDEKDASSLYDVLENEIVPMYYNRFSDEDIPEDWMIRVKESIRTLAPQFSMRRMMKEYISQLYVPALQTKIKPEVQKEKASGETKKKSELEPKPEK